MSTRSGENFSTTPFGRVLLTYMWSKTPPWNAPKVAAVLGVQRNRVNNWIHNNIVPELDTLFAVMARLDIPLSRLVTAYEEAGLPAPPLTEADRVTPATGPTGFPGGFQRGYPPPTPAPAVERTTERTTEREIVIPPARRGRGGGINRNTGTLTPEGAPTTPAEQAAESAQPATAEEWDQMITQTRQAMSNIGMPRAAIDAILAELQQRRADQPTTLDRHIAAEHQEPQTGAANSDEKSDEKSDDDGSGHTLRTPNAHRKSLPNAK